MDLKPSFEGHPGLVPASPGENPTEMEVLIGTIDSRIPIVMFDYWSVFQ